MLFRSMGKSAKTKRWKIPPKIPTMAITTTATTGVVPIHGDGFIEEPAVRLVVFLLLLPLLLLF